MSFQQEAKQPDDSNRLMAYLKIFPSATFTLPALLKVCGNDADKWVTKALGELINLGFVHFDPTYQRYSLLRDIPNTDDYFALSNEEEKQAKGRLTLYYLQFAYENQDKLYGDDFDLIRQEYDNIQGVAEWVEQLSAENNWQLQAFSQGAFPFNPFQLFLGGIRARIKRTASSEDEDQPA